MKSSLLTSSNAFSGGVCAGTGISPAYIHKIVGVIKAYSTRVGEGPFPTEFKDRLKDDIRQWGSEFGATTGRPRRCGWFDAIMSRYAVLINGVKELAVMKLDVLDNLKTIKICVAYRYKGKLLREFPQDIADLNAVKPIYKEFSGWQTNTSVIKKYADLPRNAKVYLRALESLIEAKIRYVSVGSSRAETILKY